MLTFIITHAQHFEKFRIIMEYFIRQLKHIHINYKIKLSYVIGKLLYLFRNVHSRNAGLHNG